VPEPALPEPGSPDPPEPFATYALPELGHDAFRHLAITEPAALGALSIGTPDGGLLFNPVAMPVGDLWTVRDPRESFGTAETIDYIVAAIESVEARYPGSPRLVIGDISRPDGGRLNRHKSHQAGRDADIGLYLRTGEAKTLVRPGKNQLDLPRTWALLRAFVTDTDVERVFLDRSLQRVLYAHALAAGEDKAWLDDLFGRKDGGKNAIVQHERRHQDHMHVRFYNPAAQEKGRVAYPLLVQAGLLPGPTVVHKVRSGETLSHLARRYGTSASAIRKANGLRGSNLRAGRKYVIPVRKTPVESAAVAVPPRRLPPGAAVVQEAEPTAPAAETGVPPREKPREPEEPPRR
jgi:murein endopeptidase